MARLEVPRPLLTRAWSQEGVVSRRQAVAAGLSTYRISGLVARGEWRRVTQAVYDVLPDGRWPDPFDHARRRSAWIGLLSADPRGISTGACALALHGAWGLPRRLTPEITLPGAAGAHGARGVRVRRFQRPLEVRTIKSRLVAAPVTALVQALPEWPRDTVVAVLDSALHRRLITPADFAAVRNQVRGRRGAARLHSWWGLVEPKAESPFESETRLSCLDAGLPAPVVQPRIWDSDGRLVARGDLGWRRPDGTWVLVDLDSKAYHDTPDAVFKDRIRQNAIALTDRHTHLRFVTRDVTSGHFIRTIRRALALPPH